MEGSRIMDLNHRYGEVLGNFKKRRRNELNKYLDFSDGHTMFMNIKAFRFDQCHVPCCSGLSPLPAKCKGLTMQSLGEIPQVSTDIMCMRIPSYTTEKPYDLWQILLNIQENHQRVIVTIFPVDMHHSSYNPRSRRAGEYKCDD